MNQKLEVPDRPVYMQTNRDFRLSSLHGWVCNFKAGVPERVPPHVYAEAIGIGAVVCEEQPEKEVSPNRPEVTAQEAIEGEAAAQEAYVTQACLAIIAKGDEADYKADGYPLLAAVHRELAPECPKPTAGYVQQVYDQLREHADLIEND